MAQDKKEAEPAFDLLKSLAPVEPAALGKLSLSHPLAHATHDAVVLGIAFEKFISGVYVIDMSPTVALEDITKARYIIYLIHFLVSTIPGLLVLSFCSHSHAFLVIAMFLQRLPTNWHGAKKLFLCLCGSGVPTIRCLIAWRQWAVQILQCIVSLPGGSGQCNSCYALPHCLGAVGSTTPALHRLTA